MDSGLEATSALAPVPAYPRAAVEEYLADARRAVDHLVGERRSAEQRRARAEAALEAAESSHRLLGQMMVEAQQDLAARLRHAEEAAARLLAGADEEAEAILSRARAQVGLALGTGGPAASAAEPIEASAGELLPPPPAPLADPQDREDGNGRPPSAGHHPERPTLDQGLDDAAANGDSGARLHSVAAVAVDAEPARRRWFGGSSDGWPFNEASKDESYFSRLRDELRADGTLGTWFETA